MIRHHLKDSVKSKINQAWWRLLHYCLLADGHIDIVVESGLNPWNIRALEQLSLTQEDIKNLG